MSTIRQAVALCCPSASFVFHNPFGETKLFDFAILQLPNPFLRILFTTCVPNELAQLRLRIVNPDADDLIVRNAVLVFLPWSGFNDQLHSCEASLGDGVIAVAHTDQVFAIALQEFLRSRVSGL